jgi:hypothetical protein
MNYRTKTIQELTVHNRAKPMYFALISKDFSNKVLS